MGSAARRCSWSAVGAPRRGGLPGDLLTGPATEAPLCTVMTFVRPFAPARCLVLALLASAAACAAKDGGGGSPSDTSRGGAGGSGGKPAVTGGAAGNGDSSGGSGGAGHGGGSGGNSTTATGGGAGTGDPSGGTGGSDAQTLPETAPTDSAIGNEVGSPAGAGLLAAGAACPPGPFSGPPLPANPVVTMVKGGLGVTEGPVWLARHKALYFSEFEKPPGRIYKYTPADKMLTVIAENIGVNGLAIDAQGMLVAASQDMRRLTRFDPTSGQRTPVPGSDSFMGKPFNAVNDVIVRGDGNMYFTDPTFLNEGRPGQGVTAYYRLSPAGEVTRLGTGPQPNSPGISPDGKWLYVTSSGDGNAKVWRHPLNADGSVGPRTDFLSVRSESLAIDCAGNLYLSAAGKMMVYSEAGMLLSTFGNIPAGITNLAIGGEDAKMLYITARGALYETPINIPGLPF